ncbi:hypothetical protein DdX_20801 [Ditylenchus destructor]|uniref:Uncharacterized protein n=1 Tax=Ditylenchus destructor TaxID=166010 RepID=A0AAD4MGN3_9BILA|nr:hypothetical protein DdX_20801 [Ditylenchus destructor]
MDSVTSSYPIIKMGPDPNHRELRYITSVFSAHVKVNDDNWPLFQHFVRLATDPFIYIDIMELTYQNDVLDLLAGAINSDNDRLQCKDLDFNLNGNSQKSITWAKNHKFLDLENWDEYQGVQSIEGFHFVKDQDIQVWKKDYSKFIVKEERDENHRSTEHVFEFTNNAIGKKLQLTAITFDDEDDYYWYFGSPTFSLKINNL